MPFATTEEWVKLYTVTPPPREGWDSAIHTVAGLPADQDYVDTAMAAVGVG
jgi:hypothetical protein